ncbi:putative cytochrome P450 E-class, group IV [Podospora aff. communis PSN243]|uniref:Cytochrome P450 E-class, group IV n=1 Tax=Podospora aff. communis PSN243 TaxID=3040156 RepID=A0AAV9GAH7_9PEZI|nr:putative cytochrome P450 E-class, group IV [Podospora aff. communis PSN243]
MSRITAIQSLFEDKMSLVLPTIAILVAALILRPYFTANPLSHIAQVGEELGSNEKRRQAFLAGAKALYREGYHKFKDGIFRIVTSKANTSVVVVAPRYLEELKKLPDNVLSMEDAIAQTMHAKYTKLPIGDNSISHTIKTSLNPALPRLNETLLDEVQRCFLAYLPPCEEWTPIRMHPKLLRIVAEVSGRVFVGPELCHDEQYLDAAINYTVDVAAARRAIDRMEPWKRPFLSWRLPEVQKLDTRFNQATAFLRPVMEARLNMKPEERPDDMLTWLMNERNDKKIQDRTAATLAKRLLALTFASTHTTTMASTNAFYDLAAHPTAASELRHEITSILSTNNNTITTPALHSMKKLDSFLKESFRFHPPSVSSFTRKLRRPIRLSTGESLPAGVTLEVPAHAVTRDPDIFPNPDEFKPFRFYDMARDSEETAARNQFVSVSGRYLSFGYGRHACPGRFLAGNEIKLIVAMGVLMYDVRLAGGGTERYENLEFGSTSIPDPSRELLFRRIRK